jgi:hypothetical protein
MTDPTASKKPLSFGLLAVGIVLVVAALVMDFSGSESTARGPMLVIGALWRLFLPHAALPQDHYQCTVFVPIAVHLRRHGDHPSAAGYFLLHHRLDGH